MPDHPAILEASTAQRRAADPAVSAWVDASAGSGKTKVLTDRVLALLLAGARPHAILCLTFTNAAAGEMANRVADRLSLWVRADHADLIEHLTDLLGRPPETDEIDRARRLFARVQESAGGVRIETVHAFCQGVLQRFPVEARVPPHFDVLDERDQRLLLANARDGLVRAVAADPESELARAWNHALERLSEVGFEKLSLEIAAKRARLQTVGPEDVAKALGIAPGAVAEDFEHAARIEQPADVEALRSLIPLMASAKAKDLNKLASAMADFLSASPDARDLDSYTDALLRKDRKPKALGRLNPFKAEPHLFAPIEEEQMRLVRMVEDQRKAAALADTTALLTVASELAGRYETAKRARSQLDYDDLILGAARLLVDPGAAWVHFKLDGGIDHVLVDEAQDTNPAQWQVIAGLIAEFFAGDGGASGERHRTLFAVGDPKQSIYSFQGADPAGFLERRAGFAAAARAAEKGWRDEPLTVSFRSAPPVLQFVDAVFADSQSLGVGDTPVRHQASRGDAPGWIEVWPPLAPAEANTGDDVWQLPRDYEASLSTEERLARVVAEKIQSLIDSGEPLAARNGRPIRPGDIMVLVRRRRRFGSALVAALKRLDVPVAGVDRMALTRQLAVQDLVAFGQFLLLPEDDLTLAAVLKGPFFQWAEERLFALAYGRSRSQSLWQALQASETPDDNQDAKRLSAWLHRHRDLSPFALYSRLLTQEGGRTQVRAYLGPEADDPVDEFLALALEFPRHGPPTLQHFLQWLAADDVEIKRELDTGDRDEVRLLTVHAAKGLQAPIVILPDTLFQQNTRSDALVWVDGETPIWPASQQDGRDPVSAAAAAARRERSQAEEARLLYVALTRAEDRLYIGGWLQKNEKIPDDSWYARINATCERLTGEGVMQPLALQIGELQGEGFAMGDEPAGSSADGDVQPAPEPLPYWASEPAPPEPSPARPLAPSRPSPMAPALRSPLRDRVTVETRFRRGTLLHRLLQYLPGIPPEGRAGTAERVLSDAMLSPEDLTDLVAAVAPVLDNPRFAPVFAESALVEAPLTGLVDGNVVSGTIDRLLVTPAKVLIVDYKTNRNPPSDPRATPPAYARQMRAYAALLRGVYPDRAIEAALLWTEVPRLDPVDITPVSD